MACAFVDPFHLEQDHVPCDQLVRFVLVFFVNTLSLGVHDMAIEWWWILVTVLQWFLDDWTQRTCNHCSNQNYLRGAQKQNKCSTCGLKRSYQERIGGPATTSTGADVRVAKVFQGAVDGTVSPRANPRVQWKSLNLKEVTDETNSLEAALPATPKSTEVVMNLKPIGFRVDANWESVNRCIKRQELARLL